MIEKVDVLKYIFKKGPLTIDQLTKHFYNPKGDRTELIRVLTLLMDDDFIGKDERFQYFLKDEGKRYLDKLTDVKNDEETLRKETLELIQKQKKMIDDQREYYEEQKQQFRKQRRLQWIGIGITLLIALISLFKEDVLKCLGVK